MGSKQREKPKKRTYLRGRYGGQRILLTESELKKGLERSKKADQGKLRGIYVGPKN